MTVWKDAHAIFFKFNHLYERTGYLGNGILGEGAYKFSVAPYYFIYKIFGYESAVPYYALNLLFYFFSTLIVYKLFSYLLSEKAGRVSGFLFAAGYIASDGFYDLAGSMIFNVSIILLSASLIFYHRYSKERGIKFYALALFFYFSAVFLTPVRVHYFIAILALFDLLWVTKRFSLKEILYFIVRLAPFSYIFYTNFLINADSRTSLGVSFIKSLLEGKIHYLYSFFGTFGFMFFPDRQFGRVTSYLKIILDSGVGLTILELALISGLIFILSKSLKNVGRIRPYLILFFMVSTFWIYLSNKIALTPSVYRFTGSNFLIFSAGLLLSIFIFLSLLSNKRKEVIFLLSWLVLNLYVYTSYDPLTVYPTWGRYLAHSFVPQAGLLSLVFTMKGKKILRRFLQFAVIGWGVLNIANSVVSQHEVLVNRSIPSKNFYKDLKSYLPKIEKGDILYFDVAKNAEAYFNASFTVGQMPEETAIAWKYGVDRYDFSRVTSFEDLLMIVEEQKTPISKIYSYFYTKEGLNETTGKLRKFLAGEPPLAKEFTLKQEGRDLTIDLVEPFDFVTPVEVEISMSASLDDPRTLSFPYMENPKLLSNSIASDKNLRRKAFLYKSYKNDFYSNSLVTTSSFWRENVGEFVGDDSLETNWRPDRVLWGEGKPAEVNIDLRTTKKINRVVWINTYPGNTPINVSVEVSKDNSNWKEVAKALYKERIEDNLPQIIEFEKEEARFVKVIFSKSLGEDSPGISELWVVPSDFEDLDIRDTETFLANPFGYVPDADSYTETLRILGNTGHVKVYWMSDKSEAWQTDESKMLAVIFDKRTETYKVTIPSGGTVLSKIKLINLEIPGEIKVNNLRYRHLKVGEITVK